MKDIIIVGAGSVGGHMAANPELYGIDGQIEAFVDDDKEKLGTLVFDTPVVGDISSLLTMGKKRVIIGIAFPKIKSSILFTLIQAQSLEFPTLIANNAWVSKHCKIGRGSIIYPGTTINYGAVLGDFCVLNMNCAVGHHVKIGDFTSLAPGVNIGGNSSVGELCDIGIGASILQHIHIGNNCVVGGQSLINKVVADNSKVVGVPQRIIN